MGGLGNSAEIHEFFLVSSHKNKSETYARDSDIVLFLLNVFADIIKILVSAKSHQATNIRSAMPINRRCGFRF